MRRRSGRAPADPRLAAAALALLLAFLSPHPTIAQPIVTADQGDCTCQCCSGDDCYKNQFSYNTFNAGSAAACTQAACRDRFWTCVDMGSPDAQSGLIIPSYLDCTCSCCMGSSCPHLTDYMFAASGPSGCTRAACASAFSQCPDPGSHNRQDSYATYTDCTCKCCGNNADCASEQYTYERYLAGTAAACNADQCSARFAQCPDPGAHNAELTTEAAYSGPDWSTVDESCECACCMGDVCETDGRSMYYFFAEEPAMCTPDACSSNIQQCPDVGAHNKDGQVFASFFDCTCACCEGDECPTYTTARFMAGGADRCTAAECRRRYDFCPAGGGSVVPRYNVLVWPTAPSPPPSGGMPPGAWVGIAVMIVVVVCLLVGGGVYVWHKRRMGFRWYSQDELKILMAVKNNEHQQVTKV